MANKITIATPIVLSATQNYDMDSVSISIDARRIVLNMYVLDDDGRQVGQARTELERTEKDGVAYDAFMANYPDLLKLAIKTILSDKKITADVDGAAKGADVVGTAAVEAIKS